MRPCYHVCASGVCGDRGTVAQRALQLDDAAECMDLQRPLVSECRSLVDGLSEAEACLWRGII